jgi:hypothetical protein
MIIDDLSNQDLEFVQFHLADSRDWEFVFHITEDRMVIDDLTISQIKT